MGTMEFCDRCVGTTKHAKEALNLTIICQRCITGYLKVDKRGCTTSCAADTQPSYLAVSGAGQKYCVADCLRDNNPNVPLTSSK